MPTRDEGPTAQDTDADGQPDYLDDDDDGDGVGTIFEGPSAGQDTDGDGRPDYLDDDDDGDMLPTAEEQADPNGDFDPADAVDTDGDGVPDYLDPADVDETIGGYSGGSCAAARDDDPALPALLLLGWAAWALRRRR